MKYRWAEKTIKKMKSWFFKKLNETDECLVQWKKDTKERIQITKTRNKSSDITTGLTEIKMIRRQCYG